jgi:hypothetical protein
MAAMLEPADYIARYDIGKLAANEAVAGRPPLESTQLDTNETQCLNHYEGFLQQRSQELQAELARLRGERQQLRDRIEPEEVKTHLDNLVAGMEPQRMNLWNSLRPGLQQKRQEFELAIRRLRLFQYEHGRSGHKASYPESFIHHFALITVIALLEWISLSSFYAEGSDFGLLGGVLFAAVFSAVNLTVAIGLGYIIRNFNHRSWGRKLTAMFVCAFLAVVFVAISLLAAHYRDATEVIARERAAALAQAVQRGQTPSAELTAPKDSLEASAMAVRRLISDPWGLGHTWSWVLFLAAIAFGTFAAYKGYRMDDPYPGYGKVDREHKKAEAAYNEARAEVQAKLHGFFETQKKAADQAFQTFQLDIRSYDRSIQQSENIPREYESAVNAAMGNCIAVLRHYRQVNEQIRAGRSPGYFAQIEAPIRGSLRGALPTVSEDELQRREIYSQQLMQCRLLYTEVVDKISTAHARALTDLDAQIQNLEQWLATQVAEQHPVLA